MVTAPVKCHGFRRLFQEKPTCLWRAAASKTRFLQALALPTGDWQVASLAGLGLGYQASTRYKPTLLAHLALMPSNLSSYQRRWEEENNTGLQGAAITAHVSVGAWTFQIAHKQFFVVVLMPFFSGLFWQTLPSSARVCHTLGSFSLRKVTAESITELLKRKQSTGANELAFIFLKQAKYSLELSWHFIDNKSNFPLRNP